MRSRRQTARWWRGVALLAATAPAALAAQVNCTRPPAVPASAFAPHRPPAPWGNVAAFVAANQIVFGAGQTDSVRPCGAQGCSRANITILTDSTHTNCFSDTLARQDSLYFLGAMVQADTQKNHPLGFGGQNASDTVYLLLKNQNVWGLFRNRSTGRTQFVPYVSGQSGWQFYFNPDGMSGEPSAQWRRRVVAAGMRVRKEGGPADPLPDGDELQTSYTYAWMQCIAGCCQLIGTGDGPPDTEGHGGHHGPNGPPPGPPPPLPSPPPSRD